MTEDGANLIELRGLLESVFEDRIDEFERQRLEELLKSDRIARQEYLRAINIHGTLLWDFGGQPCSDAPCDSFESNDELPSVSCAELESPIASCGASATRSPQLPIVNNDGIPSTFSYQSSGWPMAYLMATAMTVLGLLVCANTYISQPARVASDIALDTKGPGTPPGRENAAIVGTISGMGDGVSGQRMRSEGVATKNLESEILRLKSPVALGDHFAIRSGLVEITYDTGAKVLLQGPVTYEVESKNGGFLSVGRLTGKVTTEAARGLCIRTPTAIVTDLGTEFGVEVNKAGITTSHVFRGAVELRTIAGGKTEKSKTLVLHANESGRVENNRDPDGDEQRIVFIAPTKSAEFVREISKRTVASSEPFELVAFWQFDGKDFLADSSGNGHILINRGAKQVDGTVSFDGKGILQTKATLDLTPYAKVRVSWSSKGPVGHSDAIFWEHSSAYCHTSGAIATYLHNGEGFAAIATWNSAASQEEYRIDAYPIADNIWESFTVEYDLTAAARSGIVKVFKNGSLVGRGTLDNGPAPPAFVNAPFFIGSRDRTSESFVGQIDNLKIEGQRRGGPR